MQRVSVRRLEWPLISDKIDIEKKNITKDKEGHFMVSQGSTKQKDKTVTNVYVPNYQASKYVRQKLIDLKNRKFHKHICFSSVCVHFGECVHSPK